MKSMREGWQPPVDAWQARFTSLTNDITFAYYAVQYRDSGEAAAFHTHFRQSLAQASGPDHVVRARHVDLHGWVNDCYIAYWRDTERHRAWWHNGGFGQWWQDDARLSEPAGIWREEYCVPPRRFETLFSSPDPKGVAHLAQTLGEPIQEHNYWGGMRDRVHAAAIDDDSLAATMAVPAAPFERPLRGRRLALRIPANLCLIRSGQDLRACDAAERADYDRIIRDNLVAGMDYLQAHPVETGCLGARLMDELTLDGGASEQTFGLASFCSMADLELWAKSHPSHLAIFDSFFELLKARKGRLALRLWHEVLVVDGNSSRAEYVNCHASTGLAAYCS